MIVIPTGVRWYLIVVLICISLMIRSSNTLTTWCEELTHWKRPWCWERLKAGGEGDDRGWDGWRASLTRWTWVWASSGSWWWTGKPGVLQSIGLQRVEHDWVTELNWWSVMLGPFSCACWPSVCLLWKIQVVLLDIAGRMSLLCTSLASSICIYIYHHT